MGTQACLWKRAYNWGATAERLNARRVFIIAHLAELFHKGAIDAGADKNKGNEMQTAMPNATREPATVLSDAPASQLALAPEPVNA